MVDRLRFTAHVLLDVCRVFRSPVRWIATSALLGLAVLGAAGCGASTSVVTTTHYHVGVVECEFADQGGSMELPQSYYNAYFSPGTGGIFDYFSQVSYGKAALDTTLLGPYIVPETFAERFYETTATPMTLNQYMGLSRKDQIWTCLGTAADAGVNLGSYNELIALQVNHDRLAAYGDPVRNVPTLVTTVTTGASATYSYIQVQSAAGFPTPPFPIGIFTPDGKGKEEVIVTQERGPGDRTWTITRGFEGTTAQPIDVGDQIWTAFNSDIGAIGGPQNITVGLSHQENLTNVGLMTMDVLGAAVTVAQEISHGLFNLNHSRDFISQTTDYQDKWDVMSGLNVYAEGQEPAFVLQAGYSTTPEHYAWGAGPGFNAVQLDYTGWLQAGQEDVSLLSTHACSTHGITLDALSQSQGHYLEARLPYVSQPGFPANGMYYTVEFRNPTQTANNTIWDSGIPEPTVLMHLAVKPSPGADPYISYLVDSTINGVLDISGADAGGVGGTPQFIAGSTFADTMSSAYLGVNQIDGSKGTAEVTVGNCLVPTKLTNVAGAGANVPGGIATLSATLVTDPSSGSSWPVPNQPVILSLGPGPNAQFSSCTARTDSNGYVTCPVAVPNYGLTKLSAKFNGNAAYQGDTQTVPIQTPG